MLVTRAWLWKSLPQKRATWSPSYSRHIPPGACGTADMLVSSRRTSTSSLCRSHNLDIVLVQPIRTYGIRRLRGYVPLRLLDCLGLFGLAVLAAAALTCDAGNLFFLTFVVFDLVCRTTGDARMGELRKAVGEGMAIVSMEAPPTRWCWWRRAVEASGKHSWVGRRRGSRRSRNRTGRFVWVWRDNWGTDVSMGSSIGPRLIASRDWGELVW